MIELIAAGVVVLGLTMVVLFGVPRVSSGTEPGTWPDVMDVLERFSQGWLSKPRWVDLGVGVAGLVILIAGITTFWGSDGMMAGVGLVIAAVGLAVIFSGTYVNIRRSGLYSAEATLVGMTLVGLILLLLVAVGLVEAH